MPPDAYGLDTHFLLKKKDTDNDISFNDFNKVNLPKCFKLVSFFIRCASMNTITRNIVMQVNLVNKEFFVPCCATHNPEHGTSFGNC